jgi:predicted peptidase
MKPSPLRIGAAGPLRFLLSTPVVRTAVALPVLVFLHGYDEGAPTPIDVALTRHGPLRVPNPASPADRFIIVTPQMPTRGDLWHRYAEEVRTLATRICIDEGGDPQRVYLTGFSFGGNGVFDLAIGRRDTWAALWAVDPTRLPARDPGRPVWLSFGEAARLGKRAFINALGLEPAGESAGEERVYLDEGADHVGSATLAYQDGRIYAWLLTKRLRADDVRRRS